MNRGLTRQPDSIRTTDGQLLAWTWQIQRNGAGEEQFRLPSDFRLGKKTIDASKGEELLRAHGRTW